MATLAEQLRDLCVEHDLNCVSVQFHIGVKTGRPFVSANAHYGGRCTSGNGATAEEALGAAIVTANAERNRGTATSELCTLGDVVGTRRQAMDELIANDADLIEATLPSLYRGYVIRPNYGLGQPYSWQHKDFDGPGDDRYGYANSEAEARELIDEQLAEMVTL